MSWSKAGYSTGYVFKRTYHAKGGAITPVVVVEVQRPPTEHPRRTTIRRMLQGCRDKVEFDHWSGLLAKFDKENPT